MFYAVLGIALLFCLLGAARFLYGKRARVSPRKTPLSVLVVAGSGKAETAGSIKAPRPRRAGHQDYTSQEAKRPGCCKARCLFMVTPTGVVV